MSENAEDRQANREAWMDEFYPIDARDATDNDYEALVHSLQKWKGLRGVNVKKYELDWPPIDINTNTCALCIMYYRQGCWECPLFEELGKACDHLPDEGGNRSPFARYISEGNAEPMIELLQICLNKEKEKLEKEVAERKAEEETSNG